MNIKQRIHHYTPQPVTRLGATLVALLLGSGVVFAFGCVLAWQDILFTGLEQYWILLLLISFILVFGLSYDQKQYFRFPFLIQQYLIDSRLAQDIRERALRSSDATIMGQRQIHTTRLGKQQQLLLKINDQTEGVLWGIGLLIELLQGLRTHATGLYQFGWIGSLMPQTIAQYIGKDNYMLDDPLTACLRQHTAVSVKMTCIGNQDPPELTRFPPALIGGRVLETKEN
jgi:hypothetical protein